MDEGKQSSLGISKAERKRHGPHFKLERSHFRGIMEILEVRSLEEVPHVDLNQNHAGYIRYGGLSR